MAKQSSKSKNLLDYTMVVRLLALFLTLLIVGLLVYQYSRADIMATNDVCIKYEAVTNGGRNTPIGKQQCTVSLERVSTEATREQGLSGRTSMPASRGMLFAFDNIGRQCIWMKDMKFNLDIIWLDARATVLKVAENVAPNTYPNSFCAADTFFVIEVNAGVAKSIGLQVGSNVSL